MNIKPSSSSADFGTQSTVSDIIARQRPIRVSSGNRAGNQAL